MSEKTQIVIFTMGTRGDVQPYLFLAKALKAAGCHPVIATHPCWKQLTESYGIQFSPIGPNVDIESEAAVIRGKSKNWILGFIRTMKFVFRIIENASDEIYQLCQNADLVISSHSHIGANEAEACGVKTVSVTLQPETIPQKNKLKTRGQAIAESVLNHMVNPSIVRPYNRIRKKLNLKPIHSIDEITSQYLNLIPISSSIVKQNVFWDQSNHVVGYWFDDEESYQPSDELTHFLKSGERPVIVALGAMSFESREEKEKLDILVHAIHKAGMRAVIQGFQKTLKNYELPETMIKIGSVPHSWLFRQGFCVIHHGGFGTSASAMLYGIPSIVIPHVLDQFLWADKIYKLNAGMKPIKAKDLNEQNLTDALEQLKQNYNTIKTNVQQLSLDMKKEDGLGKSVLLIQNVLNQ